MTYEDGVLLTASALAFVTVLSLIPLLAALSFIGARVFSQYPRRSLEIFVQILPYSDKSVVDAIAEFVDQAATIHGVGVIAFFVTTLFLFATVEETFNKIWNVSRRRPCAAAPVSFLLLIFWGPLLVGATFSSLILLRQAPALRRLFEESLLLNVLPFAATVVGLTMLYWRVPYTSVQLRSALAGGLLAGILLEILRESFGTYVEVFRNVSIVYGSYAFALLFMISIDLTWTIILFGAVATYTAQHFSLLAHGLHRHPPVQAAWVGLAALALIARRFDRGEPPLSREALADRLCLPTTELERILRPVAAQGLLQLVGDHGYALPTPAAHRRRGGARRLRPPRAARRRAGGRRDRRTPPGADRRPRHRPREHPRPPHDRRPAGPRPRRNRRPCPRGTPAYNTALPHRGAVAQLGEHHVRNVGVEGSSPFCSTISLPSVPASSRSRRPATLPWAGVRILLPMDRVAVHEIDKVLLRPGQSVRFEDRDDLLEALDRLDQPVPARHEGRTRDHREHFCMVRYLRFVAGEGLLPLPVTLSKPPEGQDPPDFVLEWPDWEAGDLRADGRIHTEVPDAAQRGEQGRGSPGLACRHQHPREGSGSTMGGDPLLAFLQKAEGLRRGRFDLDHLIIYDLTGLGLLLPLERGAPILRQKVREWHAREGPQHRFKRISILRDLALLLDLEGEGKILRQESPYFQLPVIRAHDEEDLERRLREIDRYCRQNFIRHLRAFGSILGDRIDDVREDSDLDLLVEFEPGTRVTLLDMARMERELGELIGFKVDLRTAGDLSRYFRQEVLREAVELRAARG